MWFGWPGAWNGVTNSSATWVGGFAVLVLASCTVRAQPGETTAHPPKSVVLIVLDTVRADHLGVYGYSRETTPHLDAFAARSMVYRRAMSSAPWTLPAHASLFTGRPSSMHGAHLNDAGQPTAYDGRFTTLAETLSAAGYRTGANRRESRIPRRTMGLIQGICGLLRFGSTWLRNYGRSAGVAQPT